MDPHAMRESSKMKSTLRHELSKALLLGDGYEGPARAQ